MKHLLIGLLVLRSLSAFAGELECKAYIMNNSNQTLKKILLEKIIMSQSDIHFSLDYESISFQAFPNENFMQLSIYLDGYTVASTNPGLPGTNLKEQSLYAKIDSTTDVVLSCVKK